MRLEMRSRKAKIVRGAFIRVAQWGTLFPLLQYAWSFANFPYPADIFDSSDYTDAPGSAFERV